MRFRSLRVRVILGSLLWTGGLLAVGHILSIAIMRRYPVVMKLGHGSVMVVAIVFMIAGLIGMRSGLSPFRLLRANLAAVRGGRAATVEGEYPSEVQPLVDDLNALLEHREKIIRRALATAGDLAHGLKTPLALLTQEAERAQATGNTEIAASIGAQVDRMRRQVDYHLARARASASGATLGARCPVAESAEGLCRTMLRLYADRQLAIELEVPMEHVFQGQREDLDEMLGNLMDNACKWARLRVVVTSTVSGGELGISVDDDGPGLVPAMRAEVLQRGVRADEKALPGSGLGLAIVRDLAELYGGSVVLEASPASGLRARLRLPAGERE